MHINLQNHLQTVLQFLGFMSSPLIYTFEQFGGMTIKVAAIVRIDPDGFTWEKFPWGIPR